MTPLDGFENGEMGILGLFSRESHPANPDTIVFYPGQNNKSREFHHPTKTGYECSNWGFQDFMKEELGSNHCVSGGKSGIYIVENNKVMTDVGDTGQHSIDGILNLQFAEDFRRL